MSRLSQATAREILALCHAPRGKDFHALGTDEVTALGVEMREHGYRAPKVRNGSAVRYFHAYLVRLANRDEA